MTRDAQRGPRYIPLNVIISNPLGYLGFNLEGFSWLSEQLHSFVEDGGKTFAAVVDLQVRRGSATGTLEATFLQLRKGPSAV